MKTSIKKISKVLSIFVSLMVLWTFSFTSVSAQSATGALSINPSSFTLTTQGGTTTLSVVYTGADILGAEVYLTLGSGLKINSFTVGTGLTKLYESTTTNEFHVATLDKITSGQTLFTFVVEATSCNQSGQVGFNTTNTRVPDVTLTFNTASYNITCSGGTITPIPTNTGGLTQTPTGYTPTTLPRTAVSDNTTSIITSSTTLLVGGVLAWKLLAKLRTTKQKENVEIVVLD